MIDRPFRPASEVQGIVERLGYRVARIDTDAGRYAVLAVDRAGKPFDICFIGRDLRMVSRRAAERGGKIAAR